MKYITSILTLLVLSSCNLQEQKNQDKSSDIVHEAEDTVDNKREEFDFSINEIDRQKQIEEL